MEFVIDPIQVLTVAAVVAQIGFMFWNVVISVAVYGHIKESRNGLSRAMLYLYMSPALRVFWIIITVALIQDHFPARLAILLLAVLLISQFVEAIAVTNFSYHLWHDEIRKVIANFLRRKEER